MTDELAGSGCIQTGGDVGRDELRSPVVDRLAPEGPSLQVPDRSRIDTKSAASADVSKGLLGEPVHESREDRGQPRCRRHDP